MRSIQSWLIVTMALAVPGMLATVDSLAAQEGTITGQVVNANTGQPLGQTQVNIQELRIGALSESGGRYTIQNVPAGTHTVRAQRLGFRTVEQSVTVGAGETVTMDFDLAPAALSLDEVVVTGTAGQARRREVGNQITQLNVQDMAEPVRDVGALLQGRVAGATIREGSGNSGSAVDIRLRGNVSVAMSNQPLIYIDGVRVRSEAYPMNTSGDGRGIGAGSDPPGPLSQLNPDDIERIEIVKGPAATTLYGTEAAAGVIQIFTRRGSDGAATWTAEVQQGFSYMRDFIRAPGGDAPKMWLEPVLRNGHRQRYSVSTRGGGGGVNYFVSGTWQDNEGVVLVDGDQQWQARANLQWQATDALRFDVNNAFSESTLTQARYGNTIHGIMMNANRGDQGYNPQGRSPATLRALLNGIDDSQDITRFVGGVTASYQPRPDFSQRFTVGYDRAQIEGRRLTPFGYRSEIGVTGVLGSIGVNSFHSSMLSADYVGSFNFGLTDDVRSTFSWGFQLVEETEQMIWANGSNFPGPGEYTVRSTEIRTGLQDARRVITGGFFLEDRMDFKDRYFLTLGLRVDGNSAFGENLGLEPYPKASFSYVISDEGFWPEFGVLGETKIRAAYGLAGRAPGAFDAVRTWNPIGWGPNVPAFQPGNLGNQELGPERTAEFEVGADASLLEGRLTADVTYYSQTTMDALFNVGTPASSGGWGTQLENVGEVKNSGWEVELSGDVIQGPNFNWNVGLGVATNNSEVVTLGGAAPFSVGGGGWIVEGQPAPVIRAWTIENRWEKAEPIISRNEFVGPAFPTTMLNLTSAVTLPGNIVLSGRAEYQGGAYLTNGLMSSSMGRSIPNPVCFDAYRRADPTWELGPSGAEQGIPSGAPRDDLYAWERAMCFGLANGSLAHSPSDLLELRDLTLQLPISNFLPQVATGWADRMDLTISGRNLWYRTARELMVGHPEQNETRQTSLQSGGHDFVKSINEQLPPMSYFTISLRAIF